MYGQSSAHQYLFINNWFFNSYLTCVSYSWFHRLGSFGLIWRKQKMKNQRQKTVCHKASLFPRAFNQKPQRSYRNKQNKAIYCPRSHLTNKQISIRWSYSWASSSRRLHINILPVKLRRENSWKIDSNEARYRGKSLSDQTQGGCKISYWPVKYLSDQTQG